MNWKVQQVSPTCQLMKNDMNVAVNCTRDPSTHLLSQLPLVQSQRECNCI